MTTSIKTDKEVERMRTGGRMLATVLQLLSQQAQPGVTPKDMSRLAAQELKSLGGKPAFLGYHGYTDIICISVNNQVQHAVPTGNEFVEGDVVNFDFGVLYEGLITDAGISITIGEKSTDDAKRLLTGTRKALDRGLNKVRAGCHVGDISAAIEKVLHEHKLGIVRDLVGHGVGHSLHEEPNIPNYGVAGKGPVLKAGMTIAIEPIATLCAEEIVIDDDGWTLWTIDGSWSAQFEHTVLVTESGCEILTCL